MVGISEDKKEYFVNPESKVALDEMFSNYKVKLGEALNVPTEDVNIAQYYYPEMKPIYRQGNEAPPDLKGTPVDALWGSKIYRGFKGMEVDPETQVPIPVYEYFSEGSPRWNTYTKDVNKARAMEDVSNWLPVGQNEQGEMLYSGNIVDQNGLIFKMEDKTTNQINDIMYGWASGIKDRKNFGIDTLKYLAGKSDHTQGGALEFDVDEDGREITGAPYLIDNTWLGQAFIWNKNRSSFKFKPNKLGTPTEYDVPVGDLMAAQALAHYGGFSYDIIPGSLDLAIRGAGSAQQTVKEATYIGLHKIGMLSNLDIEIVDNQPVVVGKNNDNAFSSHAFLYETTKDTAGVGFFDFKQKKEIKKTIPFPKTTFYDLTRDLSSKIAPFYSVPLTTALITPPEKISDAIMGRSILANGEIGNIIAGEGRATSVKYGQEILGMIAGWRTLDRVGGKVFGFGTPRGKKLWGQVQKDAEELFNNDPTKKIKWNQIPKDDIYIKEDYYTAATKNYLNNNKNKYLPELTNFLDRGRIAQAKNMKLSDRLNIGTSSTSAVGGLVFQGFFSGKERMALPDAVGGYGVPLTDYTNTEEPVIPYLIGALIFGLPTAYTISTTGVQQGIMNNTLSLKRPISSTLKAVPQTGIALLSGPEALYDVMRFAFTGGKFGGYSDTSVTAFQVAEKIPDVINGRSIPKKHKINMANVIIAAKAQAVKSGTTQQIVQEIENGRQFINDLNNLPDTFKDNYNLAMVELEGLVGLKAMDNIVGEAANLGFSVDAKKALKAAEQIEARRESSMKLLRALEPLFKALPDGEEYRNIKTHLNQMSRNGNLEIKRANAQLGELDTVLALEQELLTSPHALDRIGNNNISEQILDARIAVKKLIGVEKEEISKLILDTRIKNNKNLTATVGRLRENPNSWTDKSAGAEFQQLDEQRAGQINKYANQIYEEVNKDLKNKPVKLSSIFETLDQSFFKVNQSEATIRPKDAANISNIIGEVVELQLMQTLKKNTTPQDYKDIRQLLIEESGVGALQKYDDFTNLYRVILQDSNEGIAVRDLLNEYVPQLLKQGFRIPADRVLNIHKTLSGSRRSFGEKGNPIFEAYGKTIDILQKELSSGNGAVLQKILRAGEIYGNHFHASKSGAFSNSLARYTGVDSRVKGFQKSIDNPSNKMYTTPPEKWLDTVVDMIFDGKTSQAASMLNERFGEIITLPMDKAKGTAMVTNSFSVGTEATTRRIVDPESASKLSALIDWKINNRLYFDKRTTSILERVAEGEYADIAVEGVGILGAAKKGPGFKSATVKKATIQDFTTILDNIQNFSDEMSLFNMAGGTYEHIDKLNLKTGTMLTITDEMATTNFSGMNSIGNTDAVIRTLVNNDAATRRAYTQYMSTIKRADRKIVNEIKGRKNKVKSQITDFQSFTKAMAIDTSGQKRPFRFYEAYDFLTSEDGKYIGQYIQYAKKLNGERGVKDAYNFINRVLEKGFKDRTSVRIISPDGSYTTGSVMPDGSNRVRKEYVTMPVTERAVAEMDRIPNLLQDSRFGLFKDASHMEKARSIYINTEMHTMKDLGIDNSSWANKMSAEVRLQDLPTPNTTNQHMANTMSYLRRVVSPWWIGGSIWVRELRGKNLDIFMLMARDPRLTDLMHGVFTTGKIDDSALKTYWEGATGLRAAGASSNLWGDNYINFELEHNFDFTDSDTSKIDSLQNIKMEDKATQEQLDELFF